MPRFLAEGVRDCRTLLSVMFRGSLGSRSGVAAGGQAVAVAGGSLTRLNKSVQAFSQGQFIGKWSTIRRADDAMRAGTVISFRRMVAVVALASSVAVRVAAARVTLNAMTASTSQAALAVKMPEGR